MRPPKSPSASSAVFTLPCLLLSLALVPLMLNGRVQALDTLFDSTNQGPLQPPSRPSSDDARGGLEVGHEDLVERYEPDFIGLDHGIVGRAGDDTQTLVNNQPGKSQNGLQSGQSEYYTFPKSAILGPKSPSTPGLPSTLAKRDEDRQELSTSDELKRRQTQSQLFITLATCSQPLPNQGTNGPAGQLQLFISTSSSNQKPSQSNYKYAVTLDGGYGNQNLTASDDIFISVEAPTNNGFTGKYDYEITASIDDYYAMYHNINYSRVVDTDTQSVLLYTNDVTSVNSSNTTYQQWIETTAFSVYVYSQESPLLVGIQKSSCALDAHKQQYLNPTSSDTSMTAAVDGQPKQQFHVQKLNGSSSYYASVVIEGNSTKSGGGVVNGGGTVWPFVNFTTKSDNNCAIIYNLDFCSDVGYAVPWNPYMQNITALQQMYDNNANDSYVFFNKSLQQVPCNTTSSAQYSLARNCTDCANAYKQWLCAVTIPRCEDFSRQESYLQPRAVNQSFINANLSSSIPSGNGTALSAWNMSRTYVASSRNPLIDKVIKPGPYNEVLPCSSLCYNLVQSCPAILQFACPLPGYGLEVSYGSWLPKLGPGQYSCNTMALKVSRGVLEAIPTTFGAVMVAIAILSVKIL